MFCAKDTNIMGREREKKTPVYATMNVIRRTDLAKTDENGKLYTELLKMDEHGKLFTGNDVLDKNCIIIDADSEYIWYTRRATLQSAIQIYPSMKIN